MEVERPKMLTTWRWAGLSLLPNLPAAFWHAELWQKDHPTDQCGPNSWPDCNQDCSTASLSPRNPTLTFFFFFFPESLVVLCFLVLRKFNCCFCEQLSPLSAYLGRSEGLLVLISKLHKQILMVRIQIACCFDQFKAVGSKSSCLLFKNWLTSLTYRFTIIYILHFTLFLCVKTLLESHGIFPLTAMARTNPLNMI